MKRIFYSACRSHENGNPDSSATSRLDSRLRGNDKVKHSQLVTRLSSNHGQAMIEFTIALVAIMAVVVGTILLGRMELAHTRTMTKARATAGALALDPLIYQSPLDAQFISDWQAGADNIGYTHDDEPIADGTAITLVGDITANSGLAGITPPPNAIARLQSAPDLISEFYLVKGSASESISLSAIPGVGRLISGEPVVSVESAAWLVWTGGIY